MASWDPGGAFPVTRFEEADPETLAFQLSGPDLASIRTPGFRLAGKGAIVHALIVRHRAVIAEVCERRRVRRLEVFGSAARGVDFDPQRSDVDLVVEFDTARGTPTLRTFFALRDELGSVLGCSVDLVMAGSVANPFLRAEIDRTREPVYVR